MARRLGAEDGHDQLAETGLLEGLRGPQGGVVVAGEPDPRGTPDGPGVAPDLLASEVEHLRRLDGRLRSAADPGRVPHVRVPSRDPERSLWTFTADPDRRMWLLDGLGCVQGIGQLVVPAVVVRHVLGPEQLDDVERLFEPAE